MREIVKFQTYVDSLSTAQKSKETFYQKKNALLEGARPAVVARDMDEGSEVVEVV